VAVVCEGCITNAEGIVVAKVGERVADLMKSFHGERGDQLTGTEGLEGCTAVGWCREVGRICFLQTVKDIELGESEIDS
jgi:hypothetical protein